MNQNQIIDSILRSTIVLFPVETLFLPTVPFGSKLAFRFYKKDPVAESFDDHSRLKLTERDGGQLGGQVWSGARVNPKGFIQSCPHGFCLQNCPRIVHGGATFNVYE